jgi:hypothetical protein
VRMALRHRGHICTTHATFEDMPAYRFLERC